MKPSDYKANYQQKARGRRVFKVHALGPSGYTVCGHNFAYHDDPVTDPDPNKVTCFACQTMLMKHGWLNPKEVKATEEEKPDFFLVIDPGSGVHMRDTLPDASDLVRALYGGGEGNSEGRGKESVIILGAKEVSRYRYRPVRAYALERIDNE